MLKTESDLINKYFQIRKSDSSAVITTPHHILKVNAEKRIVYGEVYAPEIIDAHGHCMDADSIESMAHGFLIETKNHNVDLMHNNTPVNAVIVESFIAREGDPDYTPGAWVVGTKILDEELWGEIKKGKYNGYSMEALVYKEKRDVSYTIQNQVLGFTEKNGGHSHAFYVEIGDDGRVLKGYTSTDDGHSHEINASSATETNNDHAHRYFLP